MDIFHLFYLIALIILRQVFYLVISHKNSKYKSKIIIKIINNYTSFSTN